MGNAAAWAQAKTSGKFDEDQHPRDPDGKFATGGGSEGEKEWEWNVKPAQMSGAAAKYFQEANNAPAGSAAKIGEQIVADYTVNGYEDINKYLNDPAKFAAANNEYPYVVARAKDRAEKMIAMIKAAPKSPGEVMRGALLRPEMMAQMKPGATIETKSFWSSTNQADVADDFASGNKMMHERADRTVAVMHINQKSAVDIYSESASKHEREFLVPPGVKLRVEHIEPPKDYRNTTHIYMTEVS